MSMVVDILKVEIFVAGIVVLKALGPCFESSVLDPSIVIITLR